MIVLEIVIGFCVFLFVFILWMKFLPVRYFRRKGVPPYRLILTGGGTAGHVHPSLSIYSILKKYNFAGPVLYLGIKGRSEEHIVPRHNIPLEFVKSAPIAGVSVAVKTKSILEIAQGTLESLAKLISFRPHLIIATGGYVSAPVIFAAFLLKPILDIKIVLNEQNLVPGLLNKVASLLSDVVLVNFKETAYFIWSKKSVYAGYPLRKQYEEKDSDTVSLKKELGIPANAFVILITGGTLGARTINRLVSKSLPELSTFPNIFIIHSMGMTNTEEYNAETDTIEHLCLSMGQSFDPAAKTAVNNNGDLFYRCFSFITNMYDYQKVADLIISRAGAGALAEIAALKKASIIIPKRGLPGDHQELNAINIAEQLGCEILFERKDRESGLEFISSEEFIATFHHLFHNADKREQLQRNIGKFHKKDAETVIFKTIERILKDEEPNVIEEMMEHRFVHYQRSFDSLIADLNRIPPQERAHNLFYKLYTIKLDEYLDSSHFLIENKGIKLIGALKRQDLYPYIADNFHRFKGFLRRNALAALRQAEQYYPFFAELIKEGLNDSYFETRREAIALFRRFHVELHNDTAICDKIVHLMQRHSESYEVRAEAIKAAILFLPEDQFYRLTKGFLTAPNIRIREALLESIEIAVLQKIPLNLDNLRIFLKNMLITTSEFKPGYLIREKYMSVIHQLDSTANGRHHD